MEIRNCTVQMALTKSELAALKLLAGRVGDTLGQQARKILTTDSRFREALLSIAFNATNVR